jgi:hypothetical protein
MRSRFCLFALTLSLVPSGAVAETFVPFVIPARPDPKSPIAYPVSNPINTDSERLVVRHGHFYGGGNRVRLWGVNLSFGANLPTQQDAPHIAARLAAAGVNTVRCHHLDTARWPRGIWNAKDGKDIATEALDRLDFFIDQLARRGIYVNINLHVGRAHSEYLGLPKANRQYDKISNIFTPGLIEAQKKYARQLLTHVNKYRKVRYADDPAVAIVEITNENSFFMWGSEDTLRTLPPYYADILQAKFNDWLEKRYGSTTKLRAAWSEGAQPLGKNLLTNADFQTETAGAGAPQDWHLEQHLPCKATASLRRYQDKDALRLSPSKIDDTEWHLQFNQGSLALKAGQYYTVAFEAASDKPRSISCGVSQAHSPWDNLGLSNRVELTEDWQEFRYGFVAKADEENARISFAFGGSEVPFYIANVTFQPGGRIALKDGESLEAGNVALFGQTETPARTIDRMCFLAETEKAYFDDMRSFIRDELGCKALVTGTIVFGPLGLYAQSDMDFIDAHAYWQHPRFPGRPWDPGNWLIDQKPMTDFPDQATLFRLAAERLRGKPFTVSEYNHPAPLDSQAECVPMIASFAAAQDWDGVWLYTYSHSSDAWDRQNMNSYFDIDTNPAKWGFMRAGAAIFRDAGSGIARGSPNASFAFGGPAPANAGTAQLNEFSCVSSTKPSDIVTDLAKLHLKYDRNMFGLLAEKAKITWQDLLKKQIVSSITSYGELRDFGETWKLHWSVENGKGWYSAGGQDGWGYTGHTKRFGKATTGHFSVTKPEFAAVMVTALDRRPLNKSRKVLITACGRCENTGMKFSEDRRTVGRNWGEPPVLIEAVEGTLPLTGDWTCHALGPDGVPNQHVAISYKNRLAFLQLLPKYKTMWYLLTRNTESD